MDVNGDGRLDLLFHLGPTRARIYINRGKARFQRMPELLGMTSGGYMLAADLDGDGDIDFLYDDGGPTLSVIENLRP